MPTIPFVPKRLVGVLRHTQSFRAVPAFFVSQEEAEGYVAQGSAWRRNKYLIVLFEIKPLKLRDVSAAIDVETIFEAATGSRYKRRLCEAWKPSLPVVRVACEAMS